MTNQNQTILIVDDEPLNLKRLKPLLESNGYNIIEAANGPEGLKKAEENPDLILLDIMMPGMDGFEVCRRLKEGLAAFLRLLMEPERKLIHCILL